MKITPDDIRELNLFKYYRVVRRWAAKKYGINESDLEVLIYLDCVEYFTIKDFKKGAYTHSWSKRRWNRFKEGDWISVWRERTPLQDYRIFKTSFKGKRMIYRIYNILLGNEDIPMKQSSPFYKNKSYTDKVYNKTISEINRDEARKNEI